MLLPKIEFTVKVGDETYCGITTAEDFVEFEDHFDVPYSELFTKGRIRATHFLWISHRIAVRAGYAGDEDAFNKAIIDCDFEVKGTPKRTTRRA